MRIVFCLFISFLLFSCKKEKSEIELVFNTEEAHTMFRIVEFYDGFVKSKSNMVGAIEDVYIKFIEGNRKKMFLESDMSYFIPSENSQNSFYTKLDSTSFSEIFLIQDSTEAYNPQTRENKTVYQPYHLSLNREGKFHLFLKRMSFKSDGLNDIYQEFEKTNNYIFSLYAILRNPQSIDFSSKADRLVFAIGWLKENRLIYLDSE